MPLTLSVTRFPLTANSQHKHRVGLLNISVKRHVAAGAAPNHQFTRVGCYGSAYQWIELQHINSLQDFPDAVRRVIGGVCGEMIEYPVNVVL